MLGCLLGAALPLSILFAKSFEINRSLLNESLIDQRTKVVNQVSNDMNTYAQWVEAMTYGIASNDDLISIMKREQESTTDYDRAYIEAVNAIRKSLSDAPIHDSFYSAYVEGYNGALLGFDANSALLNLDKVKASDWFAKGEMDHAIQWGAKGSYYNLYSSPKEVIPIYFPIESSYSVGFLGYGIFLLDPAFFMDRYQGFINDEDYFAIIASDGTLLSESKSGTLTDVLDNVLMDVNDNGIQGRSYLAEVDGFDVLVTYKYSRETDWITVEVKSLEAFKNQQVHMTTTYVMVLVISIILSLIVALYLSSALTKPIRNLVTYVNDIGQGKFYEIKVPRGNHEMNVLFERVGDMRRRIGELIEANGNKEREKRVIEMKMLQSQINPHFLFNTLNNIRLMAVMQGSQGIVKMSDSLSGILKYSLNISEELIPMKAELKVLEDYVHIQNIRYKGCVNYQCHVQDPVLLENLIPKFIFQPIVENAISHGIIKKRGMGQIDLRAYMTERALVVEISDNGVGIGDNRLEDLRHRLKLNSNPEYKGEGGLGLVNVNRRIKLQYGNEYGIEVYSEQGAYTTVRLTLRRSGANEEI